MHLQVLGILENMPITNVVTSQQQIHTNREKVNKIQSPQTIIKLPMKSKTIYPFT